MIKLSFHGAAGTVTGSKYLLDVNGTRILIDCGMYQGAKELRQRNWNPPPFDPTSISAIVLTHAHIDHVGYLPRLVKQGFAGEVYCTPPTAEIASITLEDTAHLQLEDAEFRNKKKLTSHEIALPLFTLEDVQAVEERFVSTPYDTWTKINSVFRFRYRGAGHLLGAASVELEMVDDGRRVTMLFSGDVGRYGNPLVRNPSEPPECDYLVCESTYGGRMHPPEDPYFLFAELINRAIAEKRVLLIPSFAIGRTQQIIYMIDGLLRSKMITPIQVHVDSPMAISATDIYIKYRGYHAIDPKLLAGNGCVFESKWVHLHRKRESSQTLNKLGGPAMILSASGMLTGGRILHHMINRLPDPKTLVVLVGFMAEGTLGRKLAEGADMVFIHKMPVRVKAKIVSIEALSGHADWYEILHWLETIKRAPKKVFVTHGEASQSAAMAAHIRENRGWETMIPVLDQTVEL
ncbi:hypothetical protein C3F09_07375 [candidate division GN15 bacterium]|uniref:MBL fold metallo-hydrolase n=1 Tax=candidate division GN15 bacterium TaxID=2072418 RepID=A0A855X382_9BACT|nr:MAG: hypothetical protein C3F09_07375 [candidate division GN15 bacterium]